MSRVEVDGVGIEYEVHGAGRPVVLLHGFPDSGRLWRNQVPALTGAGFQVIVPDLRGYGESTVVPGRTPLETFARDVTGLLDRLLKPKPK